MRFSRLNSESGNAILETIGFVTVAFGLILTFGLQLFQLQSEAMQLELLARNSLRDYLTHQSETLLETTRRHLAESRDLQGLDVAIDVVCRPDCLNRPFDIQLSLYAGTLRASAFGVVGE